MAIENNDNSTQNTEFLSCYRTYEGKVIVRRSRIWSIVWFEVSKYDLIKSVRYYE